MRNAPPATVLPKKTGWAETTSGPSGRQESSVASKVGRGKVGTGRLAAAQLLARDRHPNGLSAFDGDLVVRRVAEPRHRELLTRTKLDVEIPTLARRVDRLVAAGSVDVGKRHAAQRFLPCTQRRARTRRSSRRGASQATRTPATEPARPRRMPRIP
jgi:hypothetical protein